MPSLGRSLGLDAAAVRFGEPSLHAAFIGAPRQWGFARTGADKVRVSVGSCAPNAMPHSRMLAHPSGSASPNLPSESFAFCGAFCVPLNAPPRLSPRSLWFVALTRSVCQRHMVTQREGRNPLRPRSVANRSQTGRRSVAIKCDPPVAKQCGMGYTLFRKRFREYNGMSPLEYQIALRIRRAMRLLESTDLPIAQIADETGFESHAYFSRFFRKATGTSPTSYRATSTSVKP